MNVQLSVLGSLSFDFDLKTNEYKQNMVHTVISDSLGTQKMLPSLISRAIDRNRANSPSPIDLLIQKFEQFLGWTLSPKIVIGHFHSHQHVTLPEFTFFESKNSFCFRPHLLVVAWLESRKLKKNLTVNFV